MQSEAFTLSMVLVRSRVQVGDLALAQSVWNFNSSKSWLPLITKGSSQHLFYRKHSRILASPRVFWPPPQPYSPFRGIVYPQISHGLFCLHVREPELVVKPFVIALSEEASVTLGEMRRCVGVVIPHRDETLGEKQ